MQGAIINGLSSNDSQLSQQISALCSTGNCEWENYQSLGICSQCNDLTDVLKSREIFGVPMATYLPLLNFDSATNDTMTEWYLPNGLRLNNLNAFPRNDVSYPGTTVMTAQVSLDPDQTITFQDMSTLLMSVSLLKADQLPDNSSSYLKWANTAVSGTECGLYFCIQEHNTTMVNGTLHDESRSISIQKQPGTFEWLSGEPEKQGWKTQNELFNDVFWSPRSDLQLTPAEDSNSLNDISHTNITQDSIDSLIFYLNSTFNGGGIAYRNRDGTDPRLSGLTGMVVTTAPRTAGISQNPYVYAPPSLSTVWLASNISSRFANLAKSMSNSMRTTSSFPTSPDQNATSLPNTVSSLEGFQVTTLAVRWEWLILPGLSVILGCIFLMLAVVQTRHYGVPLWKAHALASVLHGFERVPTTEPYDDSRLTQMERYAKGTMVSLVAKDRSASARSDAWFLERVPGGALQQGDSEIAMVDRGPTTGNDSSMPPRYGYAGLVGESEDHLFRAGGLDDGGLASSHSTGVNPFESEIIGVVPQSFVGGEQHRIPRKSVRSSIIS